MNFTFSQLKVGKHAKVCKILQGQITHKKRADKVTTARGGGFGIGGWIAIKGA